MISIIVPHFDDVELLRTSLPRLEKLLRQAGLASEIMISDDASPEGAVSELRKLANEHKVKLLTSDRNRGFGPTVNRAVREARGEIVFVLKADVLPKAADYFGECLKHFKDEEVFAVSSALETIEHSKKEIRGQGIVRYFRGFFLHFRTHREYGEWLGTMRTTRKMITDESQMRREGKEMLSAWADGGSSAFRREFFLKLGGFDGLFAPFYWEDTDLGYRAWKAGYKVIFEPKAVLRHEYSKGSIARTRNREYLRVLNMRNQRNFLWANADWKYLLLYFFWLPYHYLVALKNGDLGRVKAHMWSETQFMQIFKARWERKKIRVRSDDEVLEIFKAI